MDIRTIRCFIKVVNLNSINKAAQELYMNHQNLGKKLTNLEQELGIELLIRSKTGISLTAEGETVYNNFLEMDKLAREIENFAEMVKQSKQSRRANNIALTIALQPSIFPRKASKAILELEKRFPNCNISIRDYPAVKSLKMIYEIDNMYANVLIPDSRNYIFPEDITVLKRRRMELVAYVPKGIPCNRRELDIYNVLELPLVQYGLTETVEENGIYTELLQYGKPVIRHYSTNYTNYCDLMRTGKYVTVGWYRDQVKRFDGDSFSEYMLNGEEIDIVPIRYKGRAIAAEICWICRKASPVCPEIEFLMTLV